MVIRAARCGRIAWIEAIPLSETRNYVQRVLENAVVYDLLNPARANVRTKTPLSTYLGKRIPAEWTTPNYITPEGLRSLRARYRRACSMRSAQSWWKPSAGRRAMATDPKMATISMARSACARSTGELGWLRGG